MEILLSAGGTPLFQSYSVDHSHRRSDGLNCSMESKMRNAKWIIVATVGLAVLTAGCVQETATYYPNTAYNPPRTAYYPTTYNPPRTAYYPATADNSGPSSGYWNSANRDADRDGVPNRYDRDANGDRVPDRYQGR